MLHSTRTDVLDGKVTTEIPVANGLGHQSAMAGLVLFTGAQQAAGVGLRADQVGQLTQSPVDRPVPLLVGELPFQDLHGRVVRLRVPQFHQPEIADALPRQRLGHSAGRLQVPIFRAVERPGISRRGTRGVPRVDQRGNPGLLQTGEQTGHASCGLPGPVPDCEQC